MKISCIVPIYNSEETLNRCVDSIIMQDYKDWECILIDDGSTDATGLIIDEYVDRDERIKCIHKKNGGVSSARNAGLALAKGEWIVFVDSDDWLKNDHFSTMLSEANDGVDLIITGFKTIGIGGIHDTKYKQRTCLEKNLFYRYIKTDMFVGCYVLWNRMFRRCVISDNSISFNEKLELSEDRLFICHFFCYLNGITTIDKITYVHDVRAGSLSSRMPNIDMQLERYRCMVDVVKRIRDCYGLKKRDNFLMDYNLQLLDLALHMPCPIMKSMKRITILFFTDVFMFFYYVMYKLKIKCKRPEMTSCVFP